MRVLIDGLDTVIEGEVIGGELLDGVSGQSDLGVSSPCVVTTACAFCFTAGWSRSKS